MTTLSRRTVSIFTIIAAVAAAIPIMAQNNEPESYRQPPAAIVKMLESPPTPAVSLNPQRTTMILIDREAMPPISELAKPMLKLAGDRINPQTNGPFNTTRLLGFTLKDVATGTERPIALPPGTVVGMPSWSPDGTRFAFTVTKDNGIELWAGDVASATAKSLTGPIMNAAFGPAFEWMPDRQRLLCRFVPVTRGPAPQAQPAPVGPVVQQSGGGPSAPIRTYQDLLLNPHDEALFDHHMTAQLALVDVASGQRNDLGPPAIYGNIDPSPSGNLLLVSRIERPYSYLFTSGSFPEVTELWDSSGKMLKEIHRHGLLDSIPMEGVPTGPRGHQWQSNSERDVLLWAEALDGGDPKNKVPHRDRIMLLADPIAGEAAEIAKTEHRFTGVTWLQTPDVAMYGEYDRDRRWTRTWMIDLALADDPKNTPTLVWDRSVNDRYGDPGRPVMTELPNGRVVALVHENTIYLNGGGATPEGDRPFLDRLNLDSLKTERLWQCTGDSYESVVDVLAPDASKVLTRFETTTVPPNYYVRDLAGHAKADRQVTNFPDPTPELRGIRREIVKYTRDDGVQLSATLYLPADHVKGEKLPLLVWAYPQEFNDASTAGQVSGSPHRFTRIEGMSHLFLLTQGYAIMDAATMPVIGDPETMNDTFIQQIVASAKACIDKADEMGVGDPQRVGVGGHSYGAFMTANLMAHSDLFKAGIARSGAYNRTLTPFGFQTERRTIWEAPKPYIELSPFMVAHKIKEPLLMIHGQNDNNPGTFPMQSERLYQAIKGNGGTARLVMLPHESHGYRAKESIMHTLAEMIDWMNTHVKYAMVGDAGSIEGDADEGLR